jgi:DNA-binding FadR family transcriptional regulator
MDSSKPQLEFTMVDAVMKPRKAPQSAGVTLADEIEQAMRSARHAPGSVLALENELQARHGAGRSVVRQAIRILAQRGVIYTRRGKGGGLIVAGLEPESASRALAIVIESQLTGLPEIGSLLTATNNHLFSNCAPRVALAECERLRSLAKHLDGLPADEFLRVGGHRQLQLAVRRAFGDPVASLAQHVCMDCGLDLIPYSITIVEQRRRGEFWNLMLQMVDALVAGNVPLMFELDRRQQRMNEAHWASLRHSDRQQKRKRANSNVLSSAEEQSGETGAERLTREILREIRSLGWKAGERIGVAEDLMQRYRASPNVLRQAIRMLEEYSAVQMQLGRHGGLLIAVPNEARAIHRAVGYLRMAGIRSRDVNLYLVQLLLDALNRCAERPAPEALTGLQDAIEQARSSRRQHQPDLASNLYLAIVRLSNNPALELFVRLLLACVPQDVLERVLPSASTQILDLMLKCILARDIPRARRALLEYASLAFAENEEARSDGATRR